MLGAQGMREIAERVLSRSKASQTEVLLWGEDTQLTRFANSRIHQNVAERNAEVRVRAVAGKKVGVATTNDLGDKALQRVVEQALQVALMQPDNPDFQSLPGPKPVPGCPGYVQATADCSAEQRARAVGVICKLAKDEGLVASGAFTSSTSEICVANSLGVLAYAPTTVSELTTVIMSDHSSGYASAASPDVGDIDAEKLGREAMEKAVRSRNPAPLEPGEYPVILEEYAVAELLLYMAYLGLGALAAQEGRSFMSGRFGQAITGSNISIWDDGLDASGLPLAFDFEGVPKQRVDLITNGVAEAVVYDSYTAAKEGRDSTGHALPAPNAHGPLPTNLFMQPGTASKEDMIAAMDRGLWVTRFHYVNPVHPLKTVLTGMTRDGTFWIENGEITRPAKNLRFTQSALEALSRVSMIGSTTRLLRGFVGGIRAPALSIDRFSFSSATEF